MSECRADQMIYEIRLSQGKMMDWKVYGVYVILIHAIRDSQKNIHCPGIEVRT